MAYLHTIGLENFRLFKERTVFELAPITILTGINNSGKSSLIKSLQLFQSSIKTTGDLKELNFTNGRHNLGHFALARNNSSESESMSFTFDLPLSNFEENCFVDLVYAGDYKEAENAGLVDIKIYTKENMIVQISQEHHNEKLGNRIRVDLRFLMDHISQQYGEEYFEGIQEPFERGFKRINKEWSDSLKGNLFDWFHQDNLSKLNLRDDFRDGYKGIWKSFEHKSESDKFLDYLKEVGFLSTYESVLGEKMDVSPLQELKNLKERLFYFAEISLGGSDGLISPPKYSGIFKVVVEKFIQEELNEQIKSLCTSIESSASLSSVRANSERLYFNNSSVVDINQLLIEFSRIDLSKDIDVKDFINSNLRRFNIGDEIIIQRHQGVASEIFVCIGEERKLLADLGFGFTQLIPIILKIALVAKNKYSGFARDPYYSSLFLLEEPESNLHPSYQSKLAELIVDAAKRFNIQFIIETHSEYMIRNFQYLTATKAIPSNATKIYYFNQPSSEEFEESPYREIDIMEDGRLSNEFGEGFFDEIPRLLAFLYNSNSN